MSQPMSWFLSWNKWKKKKKLRRQLTCLRLKWRKRAKKKKVKLILKLLRPLKKKNKKIIYAIIKVMIRKVAITFIIFTLIYLSFFAPKANAVIDCSSAGEISKASQTEKDD